MHIVNHDPAVSALEKRSHGPRNRTSYCCSRSLIAGGRTCDSRPKTYDRHGTRAAKLIGLRSGRGPVVITVRGTLLIRRTPELRDALRRRIDSVGRNNVVRKRLPG